MIGRCLLTAFSMAAATTASASDDLQACADELSLRGGVTLHRFKDGKMAMEDQFGRAISMPEGHPMHTQDGQIIIMVGNEVERLEYIHKLRASSL